MVKVKKLVMLILIILISGINVSAYEIETQRANLFSQTSHENRYVQVKKRTDEETTVIYTGMLGGYDNGRWNYVDFDNINHLTILNFDTMETEAIYITFIPQPQESVTMYSGRNTLTTADLSVETNIELNGVSINENSLSIIRNTDINCDFTITNNSGEDKRFTGILTTYTDTGTLYQIRTVEKWIDSGETSDIEIEYKFETENEQSARLMLWDSFSGMLPLRSGIQFSENNGINVFYYDTNNRLIQLDKKNGASLVYAYDNNGNLLSKTVMKEGEDNE